MKVTQRTLGVWNYVSPDFKDPDCPPYGIGPFRPLIQVGDRIINLLPGTAKIAEFRDGQFFDLKFPASFVPYSLHKDRRGRLWVLAKERLAGEPRQSYPHGDFWSGPWKVFLALENKWNEPIRVPVDKLELLHFDSQDRLWAMGTDRTVGVFNGTKWNSYTYSDDRKLRFAPLRLKEEKEGTVIIFSFKDLDNPDVNASIMVGTLVYQGDKFERHPEVDTRELAQEVMQAEKAPSQKQFDPRQGYVMAAQENRLSGWSYPTQFLETPQFTLVHIGKWGLAWCRTHDLRQPPPLRDNKWKAFPELVDRLTVDDHGVFWMLQRSPTAVISIDRNGEHFHPVQGLNFDDRYHPLHVDLDQLGRPWILSYELTLEKVPVAVLEGTEWKVYPDLRTALFERMPQFHPGYLFQFEAKPYVVLSPKREVCLLASDGDTVNIIQGKTVQPFSCDQIDPHQADFSPRSGHGPGMNPFYEGSPWFDDKNRFHIAIWGRWFRFEDGKWIYIPKVERERDSALERLWPHATKNLLEQGWLGVCDPNQFYLEKYPHVEGGERSWFIHSLPEESRKLLDQGWVVYRQNGFAYFFDGFHFFRQGDKGVEQMDFGIGPWTRFPTTTPPVCIDQRGRLWVRVDQPGKDFGKNWDYLQPPP